MSHAADSSPPQWQPVRRLSVRRVLMGIAALFILVAGGATASESLQPDDVLAGLAIPAAVITEPETAAASPPVDTVIEGDEVIEQSPAVTADPDPEAFDPEPEDGQPEETRPASGGRQRPARDGNPGGERGSTNRPTRGDAPGAR